MENVLITGGSGLIGGQLTTLLLSKGYKVRHLSRNPQQNNRVETFKWDTSKNYIDPKSLDNVDYIVHLAGAGIADKSWTKERKQIIINSRVETCALLFEKVKELNKKPKAFISASAVGYYGSVTSEKIFTEKDPPGSDFLGTCCKMWEDAVDKFNELDIRTVKIRTGVALAKEGGALPKLAQPIKMWLGAPLGSGKQYIPWIHIEDLCYIYKKAIMDVFMQGAHNAVAPMHINNRELTEILAKVLHKPLWLPSVPGFLLKVFLGERATLVLQGSRVSSKKIENTEFTFKYVKVEEAIKNLLCNTKE